MTGFEKLLDAVDWKPIDGLKVEGHEVWATHEGFIHLGGEELGVFMLSTGERVFNTEDLSRLLGMSVEEIEAQAKGAERKLSDV